VPEPRIGFLQEALRWWDQWLKGIDTGVAEDPDYRAYLMDGVRPQRWYSERPGRWVAEEYGAARHIPHRTLHLTNVGLSDGPGPLKAEVASPPDCGAEAGEYCAIWLGPEMPGDQRGDDALSTLFDSAPAEADTDIFGRPRLTLRLTPDQTCGQIAVRLCHVHPDGASTRITYGVLNLTHHADHEAPEPLIPGQPIRVEVPLDHIAYRLPKGHRLRVALSTSYWPLIWPAPAALSLRLHGGSLTLPVRRTARRDECTFPPPEAADPWQGEELRAPTHTRRREVDMTTGTVSLVIEDDFGKLRDAGHGLVSGAVARERWDIHPDDPLSAHGTCHWTTEQERGDIRLRTETHSAMWSDETSFYLSARLEAWENDVLIYERDLNDTIPRDML
jgi:predicted acyl esterase